ncbi:MAG: ABC transporter substrate-binding protein [Candidatus Binatia bacterium]
MLKYVATSVGIFLAMISFGAIQAAEAQTAVYGELVKEAKAEGEVEFWASWNKEPAENLLKVFAKKFGIKTTYRLWRGTPVQQRTLIELQSGRKVSADLISPGREAQQQFLDAGVFQKPPFEYLKVWPEIDKRQYDPSGWALNVSGNGRAVAYNSKLVPPELVPRAWEDCARPEFKGKVVLDPRHKLLALHWNRREWFLDWVKRMVANDAKLIREQTEMIQLIAAGAYALSCGAQTHSTLAVLEKGAENLKLAVPGELLIEAGNASFIRKGSPRPHAAQLLGGWLASEEGQRLLDKEDYRGFPWVEGTHNAGLAKGKKVLLCDPECAAKAGEMSAEYVRALGLPVTK